MGFFSKIFSKEKSDPGLSLDELARRLNLPLDSILNTPIAYTELQIPKRSGGTRTLHVPGPELKTLQRTLLRKLLGALSSHSNAHGFTKDCSIVTNARPHVGASVVLRMDIQNFFPSTTADRILDYFLALKWSPEAAATLAKLTTHQNALPQGAPTSPILSNLVNYQLDERLYCLALYHDAVYTRYADDLTFSFKLDKREGIANIIQMTQKILKDFNYKLHTQKKLRIARDHQRMLVTGLVVNQTLNLPRATRRKLRAIKHHLATNKPATLTKAQLAGWTALQSMIK